MTLGLGACVISTGIIQVEATSGVRDPWQDMMSLVTSIPPTEPPSSLPVDVYERQREKERNAQTDRLIVVKDAILQHTAILQQNAHTANMQKIEADKEVAIREREIEADKEVSIREREIAAESENAKRQSEERLRTLELLQPHKRDQYLRQLKDDEDEERERAAAKARAEKEHGIRRDYVAGVLRHNDNDVDRCIADLRARNKDVRSALPHCAANARLTKPACAALADAWNLFHALSAVIGADVSPDASEAVTVLHLHFNAEVTDTPGPEAMRKDRAPFF